MSGQNRIISSRLQKASESVLTKALENANAEAVKEEGKKGKKEKKK